MPVSEILFSVLILALAVQRLLEMRISQRNELALRAAGAVEHVPQQMRYMKLLHGAWIVAMAVEVWWLRPAPMPVLVAVAAGAVIAGQALRYAAIRQLATRWCVRVLTLPGRPPVRQGIYRYLRHPNYVGVVLEIAAFPLLHSAFLTSAIFTVLNGLLLTARIRAENAALQPTESLPPRRLSTRPRPVV